MAALHEIQYKAWMVYESYDEAKDDLTANDAPWHYQGNDSSWTKPHRIKVNWANKESHASESTGFRSMHKMPSPAEVVNPEPAAMWLYTEWAGY